MLMAGKPGNRGQGDGQYQEGKDSRYRRVKLRQGVAGSRHLFVFYVADGAVAVFFAVAVKVEAYDEERKYENDA